MKKILIVSDTHRKDENLKQVIEKEKPLDMLIHLGDAEGSEYAIASWVNETCQMQMISGNNDFFPLWTGSGTWKSEDTGCCSPTDITTMCRWARNICARRQGRGDMIS